MSDPKFKIGDVVRLRKEDELSIYKPMPIIISIYRSQPLTVKKIQDHNSVEKYQKNDAQTRYAYEFEEIGYSINEAWLIEDEFYNFVKGGK